MNGLVKIRSKVFESSILVLLFWVLIGALVQVWVPHGQDAGQNILHVQNGPLISRLVHFSYIFLGTAIYKLTHWMGISALQSLGLLSVLSIAVSGWAVFKIGYHLSGRTFGWTLSLLVCPLPLIIAQAQGQEYQPFATSMMILSWYFWIVRKSLIATSIAWAVSVLANPASAFLFATFTGLSLLEDKPLKAIIIKSLKLWSLSSILVIGTWAPFYKVLFFGDSGWAVVPILTSTGVYTNLSHKLYTSFAFFFYAVITNYYFLFFTILFIPFKDLFVKITRRSDKQARTKVFLFLVVILLHLFSIFSSFDPRYGRYYSPLLIWLALFFFLWLYSLNLPSFPKMNRHWLFVGILQILFVIIVIALPYKHKAYLRYSDYQMIAEKYSHLQVVETGALIFTNVNKLEKRLRLTRLDVDYEIDKLYNMWETEKIDSFIFVYGIDVFDRALLKRLLPSNVLKKFGINYFQAEEMLNETRFRVKLELLPGIKSGKIYLAKR